MHPGRKQAPICFCMHCMLQELVRRQTQPKTPMSCCFVLLSKRISPVPSIRSEGHRTAHGLSTSANWYGHWETALCDSVIGLHAFTGCDTVSAFASRRKLSALKLMKKDITYQETFSQVGQSWDVQPHIFQKVQQFTCPMYVAARRTIEVKDLRYQLFCAKRG